MTGEDTPTAPRSRIVTWSDPQASMRIIPTLSGLQFLRAILAGELPEPPIFKLMGMYFNSVDEGHVSVSCQPDEFHFNPIGVVHGGLAATLLDTAMGCAVYSLLPAGTSFTTLEIKVNYTRALSPTMGPVRCEGTVLHMGGRTATAEARVLDSDGRLCAHGTTTCLILRPDVPETR